MLRLIPRDVATELPKPRRRGRRRDNRFRPNWNAPAETLEVRIVPTTTDIWTGAGLTSNFSDQNNWQSHVIPESGDDLDFPAGSENATPYDDMDGVGFGQITIEAAGYSLGSDAGLPTTGITTTFGLGNASITGGVTLEGNTTTTISVAAGGMLDINGTINGNSGLTLSGGGTLIVDGVTSNTYTGTTEVDSGTLQLAKLLGAVAVPGALTIGDGTDTAIVQDQDGNQLASTTAVTIDDHGTLDLDGFSDSVAGLTLHGGTATTGAGTLSLYGDVTDDDTTDPLTISGDLALGGSTVTFHVSPGASLELDGSIGGSAGLTLLGGGTLRLAGATAVNQYSGPTEVDAGTLELDVPNLPAIPGALFINNGSTVRDLINYQMSTPTIVYASGGSTFDLNGHDDAISGLLLDDSSVTTGIGTLTILGDIIVKDSSAIGLSTISGNLALYQNIDIDITIAPGVTLDIAGVISGTGNSLSLDADASLPGVVNPLGGGTLVFSGLSANTYTGTTTVTKGELQLWKSDGVASLAGPLVIGDAGGDVADVKDEADNQLGSGIAVTVYSNATLALYSHNDAVGPLLLLGGWVTTENAGTDTFGDLVLDGPVAADATSTIYGFITLGTDTTFTVAANQTLTLNGPIDGSFGLTLAYAQTFPDSSTHQGGGTVVMEGTMSGPTDNTYSGTTAIQYGTLRLAKAVGGVAVPGLLVIGDPNGNTATVHEDDTQIRVGGTVSIYGGGQLVLNGNDQGLSTLELLGTHDGTVVETVNGILTLSNSIADDSTANLTIGGALFLYDTVDVTVALGGTLTIDASVGGSSGLVLAPMQTLADTTVHLGGGTLVMTGMDANTYTGSTQVLAGLLELDKDAVAIAGSLVIGDIDGDAGIVRDLADDQLSPTQQVTIFTGSVLQLNGHDDSTIVLNLRGGTATTGAGVFTIGQEIFDSNPTPNTTLLATNLDFANPNLTIVVGQGSTLIVDGLISGHGFLLTAGGTLKLFGSTTSNTYTGTTEVEYGTLILDNAPGTVAVTGDLMMDNSPFSIVRELASGQIAPTSTVTVGFNGLLDLDDNDQTIAGLNVGGGSVSLGAGTLTLTGDVTASQNGSIVNNRFSEGVGYRGEPEGQLVLGGSRTFNIFGDRVLVIDALVTDGGITKIGDGELDLDDDENDYTGATTINAGMLVASGSNALGDTSAVDVASAATLILDGVSTNDLAITLGIGDGPDSVLVVERPEEPGIVPAGQDHTIFDLTLAGNATIDIENALVETFHDLLRGDPASHRVTVTGNGVVHLTGNVSNNGPFVVDGGTLDVATTNPLTGTVTVQEGGTFGGSSTAGPVNATGGTVGAIGAFSPQILTVAGLTLNAASTFAVDIAGNTPGADGFDQVISTGAVTLAGATLSLDLGEYTPQLGDVYAIIQGAAGPMGTFDGLPDGSLIAVDGYSFRINYNVGVAADSVVLSYVPASTTTLSGAGTSAYGQTVTLTATVTGSGSTPTGAVSFFDGMTLLGVVPLNGSGQAALSISNLSVGSHSIVAQYGGATGFVASSSTPQGQVVNQAATSATLGLSASTITPGQSVTLTAMIAPTVGTGIPTGTVTFFNGATPLTTVSVGPDGKASFTTSTLAAGAHALTASYSGAANYLPGTSVASAISVQTPVVSNATSTLVGAQATSLVFGQSATFVAYVSMLAPASGNPSGTVTFFDGSTVIGHATLVNGWATLTMPSLTVGGHAVTAAYGGNGASAASQSTGVSAVVAAESSATTLSSAVPQSVTGQSVTLTATVVDATGTAPQAGIVTFMDGQTVLGTAPVVAGKATLTAPPMGVGYHFLYAIYGGNAQVNPSYSAAIGETVFKANTGTGFVSSAKVVTSGQMVTYSAAVAALAPGAGTPTGTVSFYDGATLLGVAKLSGGAASLTVAATGAGQNHAITVRYSGDANFVGSVSDVVTETVVKASAQVTAFEQVFANAVGFPTSVLAANPSVTAPTGTVTFFANGKKIGQATLVNGAAGFAVLGRGVLLQSVTVLYSGDANYNAASVVPQIIFA